MITSPFSLLAPFASALDVRFLTREDEISSDADIVRMTGAKNIVGLYQMHGNCAARVREPSSRILQADAVATDTPGLTLTIRFADCQNLIVYAPKKNVVCLVHAGWKGMRSSVITSAFALLKKDWNIDPQETFVALGPSLCTPCAEFSDPHKEVPELQDFIRGKSIDLRAAADSELASLGVLHKNIQRLPDCTRCIPKKYWTYRGGDREKVSKGFVNALAVTLFKK